MAFSLMLFLMDMQMEQGSLQSIVNLVLTVGAVVFGQLAFKKANEGFEGLGHKIGLVYVFRDQLSGLSMEFCK